MSKKTLLILGVTGATILILLLWFFQLSQMFKTQKFDVLSGFRANFQKHLEEASHALGGFDQGATTLNNIIIQNAKDNNQEILSPTELERLKNKIYEREKEKTVNQ